MIYNNILELIGRTPMLLLGDINGGELYAKLEYFSPTASVKDRAAYYMLKLKKERGELKNGSTVIEATSGNTGIALSMAAKQLGIRALIVMPENMSEERKKLMKSLGAELLLTPKALGMKGASDKAEELSKTIPDSFILGQFSNTDNVTAHYETTAPEILTDLPEVDVIFSPVGSGGTIMGISRYFKEKKADTRIVAIEPQASPLMSKGYAAAHKIQGIGANFLSELIDKNAFDEIITVTDDEAYENSRELICKYGVLAGISAGSALAAAKKGLRAGEKGVIIIPDSAMRYLSVDMLY